MTVPDGESVDLHHAAAFTLPQHIPSKSQGRQSHVKQETEQQSEYELHLPPSTPQTYGP